ncbi:MAG: LLM class flavin-dependent oxidoreductase, partial [Actinobacteria bacterium]|nr:LLM class flavin-dependent oxidoreductase [Actinomycetota bacterium]
MPIGYFIAPGRDLAKSIERVRLAEQLGYDTVYVPHINTRDALQVCMAFACRTERIRVGTGVVPIYTRTPATMAMEAATIADASGGRLVLGLGVSHRPVVEQWHGQQIRKPVSEMREYTQMTRAMLAGEPVPEGQFWHSTFQLQAVGPFPELPIVIAALSPNMLRLAGEIADGVVLWLCSPQYVRDVVVPSVREGRERAGRTMEG